ncbi:PREDICTED: nuclear RNA export factor 3 [Myotis davidii]|uniref:nuclear RNA export factor 3 n=1 Tax=Myotis davidii TaxID=225400 RepID=UPI0003EBDDFC|nr:PREDICTED: nuclear RNA export factor 3 [Myotis davidii]
MGHNPEGDTTERRPRRWGIYRRRYNNVPEQVSSGIHPSSHKQQDGDSATSDAHMDTRVRYAPYAIPHCHWRGNFQERVQTHINKEREQKPPETKMEEKKQDETSGSWFKITIPFGIKYDEKWLLNLIQKQCSVPFTPVEFHYEKMQAHFFVENSSIAFALKNVGGKICDKNNEKISIFVIPSKAPQAVQKEQKSEMEDQIKVKSAEELDQGKGLEPEDTSAKRSPICTTLSDNSTNVSCILELFPKLSCLDGQEPPPPTNLGIEAHKNVPSCKGSFFGSDPLKSLVLQFLKQYYSIYDSGDRHCLLCTYHDKACFSLTIPFNPEDPAQSSLFEYFKDNRNMKNIKDPNLHFQLLRHTKRDITCTLCVLPKTQHDLSSFVVDMLFQSERMLCFCVNGVFKEVEGRSQGSVRAFTRTFITTPASDSSLCIMNDELFVRDATPNTTQSVHSIEVPTPTTSSMTTLSQEQQEMVQVFSTKSGMSLQLSQKCLHDNHWDYTRAVQVLALCKAKYKLSEEALPQADPGS